MSDEDKGQEGLQTEGNTGGADSQADGTSSDSTKTGTDGAGKDKQVDYEQRYKDLQVESTRSSQEAATLRTRVEQLEQGSQADEDEDFSEDEGFVDRKAVKTLVDNAVSKAVDAVRMQSANAHFRREYPQLVKYENIIAGIVRNPSDPGKLRGLSPEERIDAAVKEFSEMTEETKATATSEAEAAAKEREEQNRKATGLGATSASPATSDNEGKSDAEELADRKARQTKRRSLA